VALRVRLEDGDGGIGCGEPGVGQGRVHSTE
jgi:hypothetical protein